MRFFFVTKITDVPQATTVSEDMLPYYIADNATGLFSHFTIKDVTLTDTFDLFVKNGKVTIWHNHLFIAELQQRKIEFIRLLSIPERKFVASLLCALLEFNDTQS